MRLCTVCRVVCDCSRTLHGTSHPRVLWLFPGGILVPRLRISWAILSFPLNVMDGGKLTTVNKPQCISLQSSVTYRIVSVKGALLNGIGDNRLLVCGLCSKNIKSKNVSEIGSVSILGWPPNEHVPPSCYLGDRRRSRIWNVLALVWNEYYFISETKLNRLCTRVSEMQM
jgi:hypothetical protein